jgi:ATP phosphoribosyltransferase regulatory subunit
MDGALGTAGAPASRIDVSHAGVFRALAGAAGLDEDAEQKILQFLQAKDVPGLRDSCAGIEAPCRRALLCLPDLYGGAEVLDEARAKLPALPELPLSFDLADLRGYNYHNGVVFSAYHRDFSGAVAQGGRYDGVGQAFGRARPATGFSMDLRVVANLTEGGKPAGAVLAPCAAGDGVLAARIAALRAAGTVVVELLPGETRDVLDARANEGPFCDRRIVRENGDWVIRAIEGEG